MLFRYPPPYLGYLPLRERMDLLHRLYGTFPSVFFVCIDQREREAILFRVHGTFPSVLRVRFVSGVLITCDRRMFVIT
jgi:hypothetical protein